jgi:hypothetical protein
MGVTMSRWVAVVVLIAGYASGRAQTRAAAGASPGRVVIPQVDREIDQIKRRQFLAYDPNYEQSRAQRIARTYAVGRQIIARETAGQDTHLAHQILSEIVWLIACAADFQRMDARLRDLELALAPQDSKADANGTPRPVKSHTEWFFEVDGAYGDLNHGPMDKAYLLDRINSPEKLTAYFTPVSVSDISRTGVDNERQFNESLSNLMRLIIRGRPKGYPWHPKLKDTVMDLILHRFRNPATGWWGERYVIDGQPQFVDHISMTFHVVSYLQGNVPDMDKVVATTLAVKDLNMPVGWLYKGQYWNHINMDVVELFKRGWSHTGAGQQKAVAGEIHKMLDWLLAESLQEDGSFKLGGTDESVEEATYYGASFLDRIGFFDKSKRFWTDEDFPQAEGVRQRILTFVEKHRATGATGGEYYESILDALKPIAVQEAGK